MAGRQLFDRKGLGHRLGDVVVPHALGSALDQRLLERSRHDDVVHVVLDPGDGNERLDDTFGLVVCLQTSEGDCLVLVAHVGPLLFDARVGGHFSDGELLDQLHGVFRCVYLVLEPAVVTVEASLQLENPAASALLGGDREELTTVRMLERQVATPIRVELEAGLFRDGLALAHEVGLLPRGGGVGDSLPPAGRGGRGLRLGLGSGLASTAAVTRERFRGGVVPEPTTPFGLLTVLFHDLVELILNVHDLRIIVDVIAPRPVELRLVLAREFPNPVGQSISESGVLVQVRLARSRGPARAGLLGGAIRLRSTVLVGPLERVFERPGRVQLVVVGVVDGVVLLAVVLADVENLAVLALHLVEALVFRVHDLQVRELPASTAHAIRDDDRADGLAEPLRSSGRADTPDALLFVVRAIEHPDL